ncbi:Na+/H+ antiporter subunit E [Brevibacterium litoralis]|uniref:Na+/H+ antiporter subunit E n=1 Tax=Brevibacterium litoralis TaxID=3138935 RepID=UPI0032EBA2A6
MTDRARSRARSRARRRTVLQQVVLIVVLALLWVLLWDTVSVVSVLTGAVLAWVVSRVFYLPPVELSGRFHVGWALVFLGWFAWQVVLGSLHVAWSALGPHRVGAGSVLAVDLHTRSDLMITVVSQVNGLIPGSVVLEADRVRSTLYIHSLDAAEDHEIEAARAQIGRIELFLVRAFGSPHDISALNDHRAEQGLPPVLPGRSTAELRARALRERAHRERRRDT